MMKKKTKEAKTKYNNEPLIAKEVREMNESLFRGNFFLARKLAKKLMSSQKPEENALAKRVLKITWPDPIALSMGIFCLAFSTTVAFLAAY